MLLSHFGTSVEDLRDLTLSNRSVPPNRLQIAWLPDVAGAGVVGPAVYRIGGQRVTDDLTVSVRGACVEIDAGRIQVDPAAVDRYSAFAVQLNGRRQFFDDRPVLQLVGRCRRRT